MERTGLSWIKAEIDAALKQACVSLETYAEGAGDPSALEACASAIDTVSVVLKTVRITGGELLAATIKEAIAVLTKMSIEEQKSSLQCLMEAILTLRKYLERIIIGQPDSPILVLAKINDLRSSVGLTVLPEEATFNPNLDSEIPITEEIGVPPADLGSYVKRLRSAYQQGLLAWLRGSRQGLVLLRKVISVLGGTFTKYPFGRVWWAAGGLAEALYEGGLDTDESIKSFFREGDRQLKYLAETGDPVVANVFSPQALKTILYHVMRSRSHGNQVQRVRTVFGLDSLSLPVDERQRVIEDFYGPEHETFVAVSKLVEEEIKTIKGSLEIRAHSGKSSAEDLHNLADILRHLLDTLTTLGLPKEIALVADQVHIVEASATRQTSLSQDTIQSIADGLLQVESTLKHIGLWGFKVPSDETRDQAADEPQRGMTLSAAELGEIRALVANEAKADLATVKDLIRHCVTSIPENDQLDGASHLIDRMAGVLHVAELDEAAQLVSSLNGHLNHSLAATGTSAVAKRVEALAEAVIGIEDYLQALAEQHENAANLLKTAVDKLGMLPILTARSTNSDTFATVASGSPDAKIEAEVIETLPWKSAATSDLPLEGQESATADLSNALDRGVTFEEETALVTPYLAPNQDIEGGFTGIFRPVAAISAKTARAKAPEPAPTPSEATTSEAPANSIVAKTQTDGLGSVDRSSNLTTPLASTLPPRTQFDPEIAEVFIEEAQEVLATIRNELPRWQQNPVDDDALVAVRRAFHTLKGSGRLAGSEEIGELAWSTENLLNRVIDGMVKIEPTIFVLLDEVVSVLPQLLTCYRSGRSGDVEFESLISKIVSFSSSRDDQPKSESQAQRESDSSAQTPPEALTVAPIPAGHFSRAQFDDNAESNSDSANLAFINFDSNTTAAQQVLMDQCGIVESCAEMPATIADPTDSGRHAIRAGQLPSATDPISQHPARLPQQHQVKATGRTSADPVLLSLFIAEGRGHISTVSDFLERCRQQEGMHFVDENVSRALHTLHGNARTAGIQPVMRLVVDIEAHFKRMHGAELPPNTPPFHAIARAVEEIEAILTALESVESRLPDEADLQSETAGSAPAQLSFGKNPSDESGQVSSSSGRDTDDAERESMAASHGDRGEFYDADLIAVFLEEASEILDSIDPFLDKWRNTPDDKAVIHELQRNLHTLKGGARMSGIGRMGDLSHALESVLSAAHEERLPVTDQLIDYVQQGEDRLLEMLQQARKQTMVQPADDLISTLHALLGSEGGADVGGTATTPSTPSEQPTGNESRSVKEGESEKSFNRGEGFTGQVRVNPALVEKVANLGGEVSIARARIGQQINVLRFNLGEMDETIDRLREQLHRMEIETEAQVLFRCEQNAPVDREQFDPLELDRYSQVQQLSRSVIESVSDLVSIRDLLEGWATESETLLLQQARVVTELQQGLMAMRLVPFGGIVSRMQHLVRQTGRELGKKVQLRISGVETEIDRTVLSRLAGCIEHMLRNAIDHGIEAQAIRSSRGKPEVGTIHLAVTREASEIVITVDDDGAGLPFDHIQRKSVERGLIRADETLSQRELAQFILEPAFSTASKLSQISGRGVGMDVVNTEIAQLGGNLEIDSTPGQGTTFRVRLPFAINVTQALMVKTNEAIFAIPHDSIEAVVRMSPQDRKKPDGTSTEEFTYRGQSYRLYHLGQVLGYAEVRSNSGIPYAPVLLMRTSEYRAAFLVDELSSSQEIIIKPVGPMLSSVRWLAGATILADGNVVLVLDMPSLVRLAVAKQQNPDRQEAADPGAALVGKQSTSPTVLVVDDSITVRKVTSRLLESEGMRVVTAKDGIDAVSALQSEIPDIMLLDVEMPRMDGYELATQVRSDSRLKHLPMIMITSRTAEKHQDRAKEIGVNRYLGKPYSEQELLSGIRELLAGT